MDAIEALEFAFHALSSPLDTVRESINHVNSSQAFTLFPNFPEDIRFKIWQAFIAESSSPRWISIEELSTTSPSSQKSEPARTIQHDRPAMLPITSSAALLLVDHEASRALKKEVPVCFQDQERKGLRFNFASDAICYSLGKPDLRDNMRDFPQVMNRIQYLDIVPSQLIIVLTFDNVDFRLLTSLRLLTVRWGAFLSGHKYAGFNWLCLDEYDSAMAARIFNLGRKMMMQGTRNRSGETPVLGLSLPGTEHRDKKLFEMMDGFRPAPIFESEDYQSMVMRNASASTWDRLEVDVPEQYLACRDENKWEKYVSFAYEVEMRKD